MKLQLPAEILTAYLFDCDGTIAIPCRFTTQSMEADPERMECRSSSEETLLCAWGGMPIAEIISRSTREYGLIMPVETLAARKKKVCILRIAPETQKPGPSLSTFFDQHAKK